MSVITLRQLEIFVQVVEHGSFRRCAEHIGVSPVSVSEHVRELEKRLGRPLFEREPGGAATLTAAGHSAYEQIRNILADVDNLVWSGDGAQRVGRRLAVAMHPFVGGRLLASISAFRECHPDLVLKVEMVNSPAAHFVQLVRDRQADLAFMLVQGPQDAPDTELVAEEPMAFFVARDHPLAAKPCVDLGDLANLPAVQLGETNPLRHLTDGVMAAVGLTRPRIALENDEYGLILTSVSQGLGYVCMFASNATTAADRLMPLKTCFPVPMVQVRCAMARSARHNSLLRELQQLLTDEYRASGLATAA